MFRLLLAVFAVSIAMVAGGDVRQTPGNASPAQPSISILGRPSPPQPIQRQSLDYFAGTWNFTWTGRESPLTPGPRTGVVTYTRLGDSNFLEVKTDGRADGAGAYQETGTIGWHDGQKILALHEQLAKGIDLLSVGDWTSPISIRFESAPVRVDGQMLRLRRSYGIVSAQSFTVNEELSISGGAFVRLGGGTFSKKP